MADPVPTQPNACGLAVALPLELSDVEAALGGGPYCDYVSRSAALGSADKLWNGGLSRVAQAIAKLAESADGHGVRVVLRARRQDLADLFASCRVVTVLAHWRGPEIAPRDLRQPPLAFAQRLAGDSGECGVLLMQALRTDWLEFLSKAPDLRLQRSRLAEMLDQRLRQTPALAKPPNGTTWHMDTETLRHFNRTCLDRRWPDDLVAGNRLELFDGLCPAESIAASVPTTWSGVADLSSCQSAQLIEQIKQGRHDRIVVANERETNPLLRIAVLQVVYGLLAERPLNYADVRQSIAAELSRSSSRA